MNAAGMNTTDTPRALAERFYAAFAARDWAGMGACYAEDARFHDPVFLDLDARQARLMWRMLLERATDLSVTARVVAADNERVEVEWIAHYTFTRTGRPVRNLVHSHLEVRDGVIRRQVDTFGLWRWSCMALGPVGWLLGWTVFVRGKIRDDARAQLRKFVERQSGAGA